MPTLYIDSGSFNDIQVSGSLLVSGSMIVAGQLTINGGVVDTTGQILAIASRNYTII